jgi:hypothetical protein
MKIVRVHTAALCILGLVSGVPALANQAGTSLVKAVAPANQAGTSLVKAVAPANQAGTSLVKAVAPANQAGTSTVKAGPAASGVPSKARCEVDELLGSVTCD